jgi:5-methylcytosine-specific restriction enzyme subunit McrC
LILQSTSFDLAAGSVSAPAFLIDMNRVFEDFVVHALRDELRLTSAQFPQGLKNRRLSLDIGGRIVLRPDVSWWQGNQCIFVGDVKYKKAVDARVPSADLYQLHAYVTATGLDRGTLIYAKGEDDPAIHRVRRARTELEIVALDLSGDVDALHNTIRTLATNIRSQAAHNWRLLSASANTV